MRAEAAGDPGPWRQQALLGRNRWDADALRDMVREYVIEHLADDDAVSMKPSSSNRAGRHAALHGSTRCERRVNTPQMCRLNFPQLS